MHVNARQFALSFQSAFARESSLVQFGEIAQFRAMMRAFAALSPQFYLEEYHGSKRQVYFNTSSIPLSRGFGRRSSFRPPAGTSTLLGASGSGSQSPGEMDRINMIFQDLQDKTPDPTTVLSC